MDTSSHFWKLCQLSLTRPTTGYEYRSLPPAKTFFQTQFPHPSPAPDKTLQATLLSLFHSRNGSTSPVESAQAGLCLRCNVSDRILKACQRIDHLFSGDKQFSYRDLLPYVLNDDGKTLVLLDGDGKTQLQLGESGQIQPAQFEIFAVEVLRTYRANSVSSMSLNNWATLQTRQHPELQNFLAEFGFQRLTDWALLNRVRAKQLEQLSERDRHIVEVFHSVYRRDRQQQQQMGKCPDPTVPQLTEMQGALEQRKVSMNTPDSVLKALKQVAQQLRQWDIWSSRVPLEVENPDSGDYQLRQDLPMQSIDESDIEQQELYEFLRQLLETALLEAIQQALATQIKQLESSKKYAPFAASYTAGLRLYYCQGMSLREIGPQLGMTSWDQTRRILNPGELISKIRLLTVQQMLEQILKQAQEKGLASDPPEPTYVKTVAEQLEAVVDAEIFVEAVSEIKAGKNRAMDSAFAQRLKPYLEP